MAELKVTLADKFVGWFGLAGWALALYQSTPDIHPSSSILTTPLDLTPLLVGWWGVCYKKKQSLVYMNCCKLYQRMVYCIYHVFIISREREGLIFKTRPYNSTVFI